MSEETLFRKLREKDIQYRTIKTEHVPELLSQINKRLETGQISPDLHTHYLRHFDTSVPGSVPNASHVIVLAAIQYPVDVRLNRKGDVISIPVPPTYNHRVDSIAESIFSQQFTHEGFIFKKANLPLKLLATSCGLSQYGKNNISYISGLGSYYRLSAYYTDFPFSGDHWGKPKALKQCDTCKICQKICPTNAISGDRFLIKADRCLTFFNEHKDDFPAWIDTHAHNSVIGCMLCQKHCPLNKHLNHKTDFICEFTEEETNVFVNTPRNNVSDKTMLKLKKICMENDIGIVSRNIKAALSTLMT